MELLKHRLRQVALPKIDAGNHNLPRITEDAWRALANSNNSPSLFRYGDLATRIETGDGGAPAPKALTVDRLRHKMARVADWYKVTRDGERKPALPPLYVVRDMLATPNMPLPILEAIIEVPTFAPDGTLNFEPG